ncbi:hypothetical protein ANAPC5_01490 [Anaplasma phagocytophilum]|nr:hypothetical protein ANAPC5_01490 [Anaplasma phagocytophilum]
MYFIRKDGNRHVRGGAVLLRSESERVFWDHRGAFDMSVAGFVREYRLTKDVAHWLCDDLRGKLQRRHVGPHARTVKLQVLVALCFYDAGGFQGTVASDENIAAHHCSVSRVLMEVTLNLFVYLLCFFFAYNVLTIDLKNV